MSIEVVFEKRINNATLYRDVDVEQRRQYYLMTSLAAIFVMGLLFYGWQQYRWIQLGYEVETLRKQKEELLEYQRQLVFRRDGLARPSRIDSIARGQLGMGIAQPGQLVALVPEGPGSVPPSADEVAAPLSASNLNSHAAAGDVRKSKDQCGESDSDLSTSGGSSAEHCQEAR